jgi:energy-coupling factor transporter ATP-binding protein EcfA2
MHLRSANVRKFKSIDDSEVVRFEPDVTCLVGRNESGKTAFLEALARVNPLADVPLAFDELRDYPRRLAGRDRDGIADTVPVTASFELDDADIDDLWGEFGPGVVTSRTVRLDRTYGGRRRVVVEQDDDGRARGGSALASFIAGRLPRFLYFGHYHVLPGRVSIPRLQTLPATRLEPGERTARSLLRLAGVGADDFVESAYERRKVALEVAAERIGEEVLRWWSQGRDLQVELDVDFRAKGPGGEPGPFLDIRIRDQRHRVTMNFGERSEGFVWFFSFVAALSEVGDTDPLIVLLDEPGLGLHAAAQADLLRYIGERLAQRHQVVYTTHSPFMVDPATLRRLRTVEDIDGEGTRVREPARAVHPDTLVPLRAAIASKLASEMDLGPDTLLVPSPADLVYLETMSAYLREAGRGGLRSRWRVLPAGGLHAIPALAALLGAPLRAAVLLGQGGGHPEVTALASGALVKRIECALGHPIDRFQPARFLLVNQARLLPALGRATVNRFARLFEILNELEPPTPERRAR